MSVCILESRSEASDLYRSSSPYLHIYVWAPGALSNYRDRSHRVRIAQSRVLINATARRPFSNVGGITGPRASKSMMIQPATSTTRSDTWLPVCVIPTSSRAKSRGLIPLARPYLATWLAEPEQNLMRQVRALERACNDVRAVRSSTSLPLRVQYVP